MTVYLVGAGPGDPGLLTLRGAALLARADVVVYDRLADSPSLDLAPATAERISVGKSPDGPSTPQGEINRLLVEHGLTGRTVVRLKGGDPFVFARGAEEAAALVAAGVPFEVVPGVTSAVAVPAYGGVPVTSRGLATSFTVVTGHEDPWAATETDWDAVARVGGTIVVLMGVATRAEIAARLMAGGLDAATPVAAVRWGTRPEQTTIRTTLGALGETVVRSPAVLVIGAVAALDVSWFEHRPLFGRKVVVTRARSQASGLVARLRELGADVLEVPTVELAEPADGGVALRAAASSLVGVAWVVFTSPNGVTRFLGHLDDVRALGGVRLAAVGPATAAALADRGLVADLVPGEAVGEALAAEFPAGSGRVLLPQAGGARDVVARALGERGWDVEVVEAYRTVPAVPAPSVLAAAADADAITFTASSTVTGWLDVTDVVPAVVVSIGPVTSATARERGIEVTAEADPHTIDGLVDALVRAIGSPGARHPVVGSRP